MHINRFLQQSLMKIILLG